MHKRRERNFLKEKYLSESTAILVEKIVIARGREESTKIKACSQQ